MPSGPGPAALQIQGVFLIPGVFFQEMCMKLNRSVYSLATALALGAAALAASGAAQADNVFWSVGVASPGMQLGVANAPPMIVQQPIYVQQPYAQQYQQPYPAYVQQRPMIYAQAAPVYVQYPGWGYENRGWNRGHERYEHERFEHGRNERGNGHGYGRRD
jgi:hypothetical protein